MNCHAATLLFMDHRQNYHSDSLPVYTDGSKSLEGVGCAAISAHFTMKHKLPDTASIFTAELYAILSALTEIEKLRYRNISISTDSLSCIKLLKNCASDHSIGTAIQSWIIRLASKRKHVQLCWVPSHVQIAANERADELARMATTDGDHKYYHIHFRDYYHYIKSSINNEFQHNWSLTPCTNKLRRIRENTNVWRSPSGFSRRAQVVLTRLRIGHTRLTHGHLMEGRPQKFCDSYLVPLSVEHILIECPDYNDQRYFCFTTRQPLLLEHILTEPPQRLFSLDRLLEFISLIGLYSEI